MVLLIIKFYFKYVSRLERRIKFKSALKSNKRATSINTKGQLSRQE